MKKIYYLSTCSTNKKILKEISDIESFDKREIKSKPISEKELDEMYALTKSYETLFSKRARKYKEYGLKDKNLTERDFKQYILSDYTFLNRPVVIVEDKIFVGSSKGNVESLKKECN